ncbi:MAG: serine hydrolase domain-containing protein [Candidatus Binatia bacterium]
MRKPFGPFSRLCHVPDDLESVTTRGEEVEPSAVDLSRDDVECLWRAVEAVYRTGLHPALQVCIRCEDQTVLDRAIGYARGNGPDDAPQAPKTPISLDAPFILYSASKAITAFLVLKLDEVGALHIEDRVVDYIPEFGRHGKDLITIRHVLTHRAGIPSVPKAADFLNDPEHALERLCDERPQSRPGSRLAYHATSGGYVLGAVIKRATGESPRAALRKLIAEPLGLRWMNYGVRAEDVDRVVDDAFTGPPVMPPLSWLLERALGDSAPGVVRTANGTAFRTAMVPAGNVVTTARELSRLYMCLANGGALDGAHVFEQKTIRRATSEQSYYEIDLTLGAPARWGLGIMLGGPLSLFGFATPQAFGHLGFTNILGWADPERRIGVAILNSGKPVVSLGFIPLTNLIMQLSRTFRRR